MMNGWPRVEETYDADSKTHRKEVWLDPEYDHMRASDFAALIDGIPPDAMIWHHTDVWGDLDAFAAVWADDA